MNIAALIPAYQEERHIAEVVERTRQYLPRVLVVDDGSRDATNALARQAGAEVLLNAMNLGKGASLFRGLTHLFATGAEAVVCLDADGQHAPEEIPRFLELAPTADLVVGNRMANSAGMPWVRLMTNRFTSRVISLLAGVAVPDTQCGFRLVSQTAWKAVTLTTRNYDFEGEMVVAMGRQGLRITAVPVSTIYNDEKSSISPVVDTIRFFRMAWRLWRTRPVKC
ncbi:MAG: glycosyltransferase family 2 protein [Planctomycetota bacterium]|jgi:glycosyltransferase involved in cell wall biosynthesis|nr:glycosyltransferase family 2 protein [Planctomycetota bacterium]